MTFKQWILQFVDSSNYDGDLAKDISRDVGFSVTNDYMEIYDYLNRRGADRFVLEIFREAWKQYSKSHY